MQTSSALNLNLDTVGNPIQTRITATESRFVASRIYKWMEVDYKKLADVVRHAVWELTDEELNTFDSFLTVDDFGNVIPLSQTSAQLRFHFALQRADDPGLFQYVGLQLPQPEKKGN